MDVELEVEDAEERDEDDEEERDVEVDDALLLDFLRRCGRCWEDGR